MNPSTRALLLGALLAATVIPAIPAGASGACYYDDGMSNFACCDYGARFPITVGETTLYVDIRDPLEWGFLVDKNDPSNASASAEPHISSGVAWLYAESNGMPGLQRGGWTEMGLLARWDRCYDDIYAPADTPLV